MINHFSIKIETQIIFAISQTPQNPLNCSRIFKELLRRFSIIDKIQILTVMQKCKVKVLPFQLSRIIEGFTIKPK